MKTTDTEYIKNNLLRSDLAPTQQMLFDFLGIDKYVDYCDIFGGSAYSVVKTETLQKIIARRKVKDSIDLYKSGAVNIKQLSMMYGLNHSTVYNILNGR